MRKLIVGLLLLAAGWVAAPTEAQAQSGCQYIAFGVVLTPAQWNLCFQAKIDTNTSFFLPLTGGTMTGEIKTAAPTTTIAGFNLPPGSAPTSPANGDLWTTSSGLFAQINGSTIGPIGTAAGITGTLALANGGTSNSLTASAGGLVWSDSSKLNILAGTSTANQCLLSGSNAAPSWGSCSGSPSAVSSVNDSGAGSLTFSPATGAVLGAINLANANTWTNTVTVNVNGNSTVPLSLTTPGSGEDADIQFSDAGTGKWFLGKDTANNFFLHDVAASRNVFQAASNGNLTFWPAGTGQAVFTGVTPLALTSASSGATTSLLFEDNSTGKWQLQKDASNNFELFDTVASRYAFQAISNGNVALMPGGGGVSFGLTSGLNVPAGGLVSAGDAYLGSGRPWMDVRAGSNGCNAAVGAGLADDHLAFQCAVNYMNTTFAGGMVRVPCGSYFFNGNTVTVPIDVIIQGEAIACTNVKNTTDVTVFAFPSSVSGGGYGGLRDLTVIGYVSPSATQDVVTIGDNSLIDIYTVNILGGRFGLNNCGGDGTVFNSVIAGYTGGLYSCGANWYRRVKFDGPFGSGVSATYAILQAQPYAGLNPAENHYDMVDMSNQWSASFNVADTTGTTISMFTHSVFANPISITSGMVGITASELTGGSGHLTNGGILSVTGNLVVAGGALTIGGGGTLKCAGNYNITNTGC